MPRTGFAWDLSKDGRTVVRGGYGRFFDQLFDNIPNTEDLFGITGNFSITLTPTGNPGVFPVYPGRAAGAAVRLRRRDRPHGHARPRRAGSARRARRRAAIS